MTIRVLLADDHPATCAGLRNMLAVAPDIEVVGEACDGITVRCLVAELRPDVVLLDLVMPDLHPVEFVRWVREQYPGIEVLPLTAHDRDCYLAWMMEAGAAGYLNKGEASDALMEAIRRAACGEACYTPEQEDRARRWDGEVGERWKRLTMREREILRLLVQFWTDAEIAGYLGISEKTVGHHVSHILAKLNAGSRREAARWAVKHRLFEGWHG